MLARGKRVQKKKNYVEGKGCDKNPGEEYSERQPEYLEKRRKMNPPGDGRETLEREEGKV